MIASYAGPVGSRRTKSDASALGRRTWLSRLGASREAWPGSQGPPGPETKASATPDCRVPQLGPRTPDPLPWAPLWGLEAAKSRQHFTWGRQGKKSEGRRAPASLPGGVRFSDSVTSLSSEYPGSGGGGQWTFLRLCLNYQHQSFLVREPAVQRVASVA